MTKKDTNKCKEWERQRRDRLNAAFDGLAQLLPFYDPAKNMTKIDILEKSTQFIKEIRLTNSRLLVEKCQPQETSKKVHQLQEEVKKLIIRVRQLTLLLKEANIAIPLGPSIKLLGKKRRKWSTKLISQEIENADPNQSTISGKMTTRKKPVVPKAKKCSIVKKNASAIGAAETRATTPLDTDVPPTRLATGTPESTSNADVSETNKAKEHDPDAQEQNSSSSEAIDLPKSPYKDKTENGSAALSSSSPTTNDSSTPPPTATKLFTPTTLACAKLVGPLTQSNAQNVQPLISTGMPLTINLSSTLTPVTFSGQMGFQNLSLQQLRPTIILASPIACSIPQSSTIFSQFGTNAATKTNETSLNILPKLIVPSCSLQKIPIKCIRRPRPRKKYKPRGRSKKRVEAPANNASQIPVPDTQVEVNEPATQGQNENKDGEDQARSPSPELIDISKDTENERQSESPAAHEPDSKSKDSIDVQRSSEDLNPKDLNGAQSAAENSDKRRETERMSEEGSTDVLMEEQLVNPVVNLILETQNPDSSSTLSTCTKSHESNNSAGQSVATAIDEARVTAKVTCDDRKDKGTSIAAQPKRVACSISLDLPTGELAQNETGVEMLPLQPESESTNPQLGALANQAEKLDPVSNSSAACTQPTLTTTSAGAINHEVAPPIRFPEPNQTDKTPTKGTTSVAQSSSEFGRLLEDEDVSLSSEDKISECIARSIGLIDDHPTCTDLIDLTTDWSAVVNSHLAAKSPISPTQMFLSMFPLLPRDGLMGDNLFTQKTTAGLLGCSRSSFAMNSVLLEDNSGVGSAIPSHSAAAEHLGLAGVVDSVSYSWAQTQLSEPSSSSVQSKLCNIVTPQKASKRTSESRNQDAFSSPKSARHARGDKQSQGNTDDTNSYSFTSLQPMSAPIPVGPRQADSTPRNKSSSGSHQQSNEEMEFRVPTIAISQTQSKAPQSKRSRKTPSSKASTKVPDASAANSEAAETSKHSDTRAASSLPLQSPPGRHTWALPRSFAITKDSEKDSQFVPFRNIAHVRGSTILSPGQSRKRVDDTGGSPTKTAFLPTLSNPGLHGHPNLPFELFRPAISSMPTTASNNIEVSTRDDGGSAKQSNAAPRKDGMLDTSIPHQLLSHGEILQSTSQVGNQPSQFNACTYEEGQNRTSVNVVQPPTSFTFSQTESISLPGNNYPVSTSQSQCNRMQAFQSCDPSSKQPSQSSSSYTLDVSPSKPGHKTSKVSQHFPFYLPEPSFQKRNEGFSGLHHSDCSSGSNYTYQQHGSLSSSLSHTQSQSASAQNQQPHLFVQSQLHTQSESSRNSRYQPVAVSSSASAQRHSNSNAYNQAYSSTGNTVPRSSTTKSGHSHSSCTNTNYFDQQHPLVQCPQLHVDNFRAVSDSQHGTNPNNAPSRFAPVFTNQRHPTVNWMTDPSGPSPSSQELEYSTMPNASTSKKSSHNSSHSSSQNPFSVSTLMGSNANAAAGHGNNNYCTEAIIRKTSSSNWSNFAGNQPIGQVPVPVSKPEVSPASTARSATISNYNPPFHQPHHHHPHSHAQFPGSPSQFNYFENTSLSMNQPHYLSAPAPAATTSASTSQIFLQQHAESHHQHQQHHHCQQISHPHPSSSSVTNFNLSTIFPEINDKRLTTSNSSSYAVSGPAGSQGHGGSQPQSHAHSHHQPQPISSGNQQSQSQQQQQVNANANQANNFNYFVNNLTPK